MSKKKSKKKKGFDLDPYRTPSALMVEVHLRSGAGTHQESRESRNQRTGRLGGAEKRRINSGDYDS